MSTNKQRLRAARERMMAEKRSELEARRERRIISASLIAAGIYGRTSRTSMSLSAQGIAREAMEVAVEIEVLADEQLARDLGAK